MIVFIFRRTLQYTYVYSIWKQYDVQYSEDLACTLCHCEKKNLKRGALQEEVFF